MKVYILVGVVLLLLVLWTLRRPEFFQDTDRIKGPPYSSADATAIVALMPSDMVETLTSQKGSSDASRLIDGQITQLFTQFWTQKYQPASTPLSSGDIDGFLANVSTSPLTKEDVRTLMIAYFVTAPHGAVNVTSAGTSSGPTGGTGGTGPTGGSGATGSTPLTGSQFDQSVTPGNVMPVGGPIRPELAGPETNVIESTGRVYPDLIGPGGGGPGGGGPAGASSSGATGAGHAPWTGQSTFDFNLFSASQVPGDQDLIENPYLQSAIFSPSTYSAKNEPVPYLADFSAFMR
jgi:hypothetical protein